MLIVIMSITERSSTLDVVEEYVNYDDFHFPVLPRIFFHSLHKFSVFNFFLADCKASEVKQFISEYLEQVLEPCGWQAIWRTDVFQVLVGVSGSLLLRHLSPLNIIYLFNRLFYVSQCPGLCFKPWMF